MADSEFEEFRKTLDTFHTASNKTASPFYTELLRITPAYRLVPDLTDDDESPSSKSDSSDQEDGPTSKPHIAGTKIPNLTTLPDQHCLHKTNPTAVLQSTQSSTSSSTDQSTVSKSSDEDDDIGDGLRTASAVPAVPMGLVHESATDATLETTSYRVGMVSGITTNGHAGVERRRRKLPEIPKNRKSFVSQYTHNNPNAVAGLTSLADELVAGGSSSASMHNNGSVHSSPGQRSILARKCGYLLDEDSSPDSERMTSLGDVDSGHSTAHSPTDFKSMSPPPSRQQQQQQQQMHSGTTASTKSLADAGHVDLAGDAAMAAAAAAAAELCSPFQPPAFGGIPFSQIEMLEPTHRGLHKFVPRHRDEIEVEIGDSVYVQKEADDLWCEGVNLRTGRQGIFPSAYAVDLDYNDFDPMAPKVKRERYLLAYLGSVETLAHKGTGVVCQAVRKIVGEFGESPAGQLCILEISDQGLRMVDRSNKQNKKEAKKPCIDYFYSLKNVSFCAFHPRDHRYIGFITKHPTIQRFACHVFKGHDSTRPVAEAVGRAFQHFYQKFIETAYPIEDIYIE